MNYLKLGITAILVVIIYLLIAPTLTGLSTLLAYKLFAALGLI